MSCYLYGWSSHDSRFSQLSLSYFLLLTFYAPLQVFVYRRWFILQKCVQEARGQDMCNVREIRLYGPAALLWGSRCQTARTLWQGTDYQTDAKTGTVVSHVGRCLLVLSVLQKFYRTINPQLVLIQDIQPPRGANILPGTSRSRYYAPTRGPRKTAHPNT